MTTAQNLDPRLAVAVDPAKHEMLAGVRAMAPMLLAYAPFGLLVGAAVASSDHPLAAWLSTWTIYGGAAHLAVLDVLEGGVGVAGAAVVGLLINARMIAYAVSLAPHWRDGSVWSRLAAAAMLTDAVWGLTTTRESQTSRARRRYYFGAALVLWFGWPLLVTLGVLVGGLLVHVPVTTLLPTLTLGSLAVAQVQSRPTLAAAALAATAAAATVQVDSGAALAVSAAAGTMAAAVAHRRQR